MSDVMMQLGGFQFAISTAAYQELSRSTEYRWAAQPLIGGHDALQFTGYGPDTIELRGVIYPYHRGGLGQLDAMRAQAAAAAPLTLVSGTGAVMGSWVIERIGEGQRVFDLAGVPRRQEFDIRLRMFSGAVSGLGIIGGLIASLFD